MCLQVVGCHTAGMLKARKCIKRCIVMEGFVNDEVTILLNYKNCFEGIKLEIRSTSYLRSREYEEIA